MDKLERQRKIINHGIHDLTHARIGISMGIQNMLNKFEKNELTLEELPKTLEELLNE